MAQADDTELRDLVIEALEKNGSLAKIRALLRANIFLAFEDDCENIKQNESLDNILKLPEGILSLSIIHDFLEFCNLKNTLFVYTSESRHGIEYKVKSQSSLIDTLRLNKVSKEKEPILITLLKFFLKSQNHESSHERFERGNHSTYTLDNDTSSSTSQSQSDNSSDERNKIDLRLPLDNSDTDSSSDSRNKKSSEYVPNQNIIVSDIDMVVTQEVTNNLQNMPHVDQNKMSNKNRDNSKAYTSSESTSYAELKPFNLSDEKLLNTMGLPYNDGNIIENILNSNTLSSESVIREKIKNDKSVSKLSPEHSYKNDHTSEYTYDFSSMPASEKTLSNMQTKKESTNQKKSDKQSSPDSLSSVSISDVADLLSEKSYTGRRSKSNSITRGKSVKDKSLENISFKSSNNSSDFSNSPIPSLSNLSLEYHSD